MILSVVIAALGSSCSIQPEASPNDLPAERSNVFGDPATGDEAAGTNRVYLLVPADTDQPDRLRSVLRDVPTEPAAVLESLFAGPNTEERNEGLDTAIPADVELQSAPRTVGQVLTIDVNDVFDALNTQSLQLAVAQIVNTATTIEGVEFVQLRIDGDPRVWPLGSGELTDRPLTAFDYPGLAESSQPAFPGIPSQQA
ncbi:MAG TPA: GerMN domain-containing protein [Ilumatobacteraceae bacterium]|nr:GerMN domain-containing protein [Ilumatobacteraceae bacterium]